MSETDSETLLLGIDVGTTGTKAMLISSDGHVLGEGYCGYSLSRPAALVVEQDADEWWQAVVRSVRMCLSGNDNGRVRALSISAQGGSLLAIDSDDVPIAPARSWLDRRATAQVDRIVERFGATEFFQRTGWRVFGAYSCVQLLDMRENEPELFTRASAFLGTADFINLRLTGRRCADMNAAGITQLTNVLAGSWDSEILAFVGIDEARMPQLLRPGSILGTLTADAAAALGLGADVEVIAGGHDQYCAALGAGVVESGDVLVSTGTAWVVLGITATPIPDPAQNFGFGPHVTPDVWGEFGSLRNGGNCLDWARTVCSGRAGLDDYADVEQLVAEVAPGSQGLRFFPHFDGTSVPTWNDQAKGTMVGLELRHGAGEIYRAVMEGVCFELRRLLEAYESFGPNISRIRLLGGAANSAVWTRIIADVLGRPVEALNIAHSACLGAAMLAGVGSSARVWTDIEHACATVVPAARLVTPSADCDSYESMFTDYCRLADTVIHLYDDARGSVR